MDGREPGGGGGESAGLDVRTHQDLRASTAAEAEREEKKREKETEDWVKQGMWPSSLLKDDGCNMLLQLLYHGQGASGSER